MDINNKNNTGQEKVVTVGRLKEYVDWLNETNGGSYLKVELDEDDGHALLRIDSTLNPGDYGLGEGFITWNGTDEWSEDYKSGYQFIYVESEDSDYPHGKFWLEHNGKKYTTLDNTNTSTYTGYETLPPVSSEDVEKGVTYHDITASTYTRYYDEYESIDGIVIDGYSVGDGREEYAENQLVVEKDVNYGKLEYDLEVHSLTVEIDAMADTEEYKYGVIPGSDDLPYAQVYYKTNTKEERVTDFSLNKTVTDNATTGGKTFSYMNISRGPRIATAQKVQSGASEAYKVDIYYYSDSGYTLSSTTLSTSVGDYGSITVRVSDHSFSSSQRNVTVAIDANGQVTFAIKQRKEIYGYYPVNAYREGTSDYSVDENGNMALTSADKFVAAYNTADNYEKESRIKSSLASYMGNISHASIGWLSNAGDNFGSSALSGGKTSLSNSDVSAYDAELTREGFTESERNEVCGKDVYNTDATVYNRGDSVGNGYHIAYANDVYGNNDNKSGFSGTTHLFISKGYLEMNTPTFSCTNEYMGYDCDSFSSEYDYDVAYYRDYYKDCHSYGMTSIMRRFRKINGEYVDSSISTYADGNARKKSSVVVSGDSFPKHISGKTISLETYSSWYEMTSQTTDGIGESSLIRSGENWVSGWTSVLEDGDSSDYYRTTSRDMKLDHGNWYYIRVPDNEDDDYHTGIAPFFYMVDAETCQGASSGGGYSFVTSKSIVDRYNGTISERYFELDDDLYFRNSYSNEQASRENMLTYNNGRHDHNGCHVLVECCPSAPLQEVSWIDEYSPTTRGGTFTTQNLAFIDNNYDYVPLDADTDFLNTYSYKVPAPSKYLWSSKYDGVITLGDVNEFSTGYTGDDTFAGDVAYKYGEENYSDHTLSQSINRLATYSYDSAMTDSFGYKMADYAGPVTSQTGTYTFEGPMRATDSMDGFGDGGDFAVTNYTGDTFVYFYDGGSVDDDKEYQFVPVTPKYSFSGTQPFDGAIRPCYGDVTIPYWTTTLGFSAKFFDFNKEDESTLDVIKAFNLKVFVNGEEATLYKGDDSVRWGWGVHCKLAQDAIQYSSDDTAYRSVSLVLIFSEIYEGTGDDGSIEIEIRTDDGCELAWHIDGKPECGVGRSTLTELGLNGWGSYNGNDSKGDLVCIGGLDTRSVANLWSLHPETTFDTMLGWIPSGESGDSDWC
jgi:hypothetical protein